MFVQILKKYWHWIITYLYLFIVLIVPILSLLVTASETLFTKFWLLATEPVAISAYCVTLSMALVASLINGVFGFILAWVIIRYDFPGRKILDAAVDLPFAMIFVSFPFVVRTVQPVLQEMENELEEASWSLGASSWETFRKVLRVNSDIQLLSCVSHR